VDSFLPRSVLGHPVGLLCEVIGLVLLSVCLTAQYHSTVCNAMSFDSGEAVG